MTATWVDELESVSRTFGPEAAARKRALLGHLPGMRRLTSRHVAVLADALGFMEAYPDDAETLALVRAAVPHVRRLVAALPERAREGKLSCEGLPGGVTKHPYTWGTVTRLVDLVPHAVEIDWDAVEDEGPLADALILVTAPGERAALQDAELPLREWIAMARSPSDPSDLAWVLRQLRAAPWSEASRAQTWDALAMPVRLSLAREDLSRLELRFPRADVLFQAEPIPRGPRSVVEEFHAPLEGLRHLAPAEGRALLDRALLILAVRTLEILPLEIADERDVVHWDAGRGFEIYVAGVRPLERLSLECLFFFLIVRNGVPLGYGPIGTFGGCSELGVNLFAEFRGSEIRYLYAQFMRLLRHHLGVQHFFLVPYAMGVGNPDAIETGAFWFYRKLGFVATSPKVEALARMEEKIMAETPGYRSDRAMLRRLSPTSASLDLSGGLCPRLDLTGLALAETRLLAATAEGDRVKAVRACRTKLARLLGVTDLATWSDEERVAFDGLAPLLVQLPGLDEWGPGERTELARLLRAKGGPSESAAARQSARMPRLLSALASMGRAT